jgi:chemotaxis protein MotB
MPGRYRGGCTVSAGHNNESLIIIRRAAPEDPAAKGGAWKIAYADFVTAMMAFFLVMWLINAANDKTKAQVASYFNPVKLTDSTTMDKGLNDPAAQSKKSEGDKPKVEAGEAKPAGDAEKTAGDKASAAGDATTPNDQMDGPAHGTLEDQIFRDPYVMLSQLAGEAATGAPDGHSSKQVAIVETAEAGQKGGDAYRDPFDPLAWKSLPPKEAAPPPESQPVVPEEPALPPKDQAAPADPSPQKAEGHAAAKEAPPTPPAPPAEDAGAKAREAEIAKEAVTIRDQLNQDLSGIDARQSPTLEVKKTREGVLISLTDSLNFDMFAIGSAAPKPELVMLMEKIAQAVKTYHGKVVIRGHTDARRYKSKDYDNWRLSTARAQMAYYMLIRAGVEESSVERIEGYADRDLKDTQNPESAENRRIEILLKAGTP